MKQIQIPVFAKNVMTVLVRNGFQAFVIGGAVRDLIGGFPVKDWDVASDATPDQVIEIFDGWRVIPTGIKHGTVTIMSDGEPIEVTTFRKDNNHEGHDCDVEFVGDIMTDLERRDFKMNAIACNIEGRIFDPFGGVSDIENKIISFVGDPDKRINEDPVRMMRGIRFEAQKDWELDMHAWRAIVRNADKISTISCERIIMEVTKMIVSSGRSLEGLHVSGILKIIMPEVDAIFNCEQNNPHHRFNNVGIHTAEAIDSAI